MTTAVDTASTPASGDTTAQENPPAMIKKIGGMRRKPLSLCKSSWCRWSICSVTVKCTTYFPSCCLIHLYLNTNPAAFQAGKNFREDNAASTKTAARRIVSADNSKACYSGSGCR